MKHFLTHWLPVLLWAGIIFTLSNIPSLESGFSLTWDVILRKMAHAGVFGILAILILRALGELSIRSIVLAAVISVLYAASDEFHQTFVAGREGTPWDVLVDSFGIIIGLALAWRVRNQSALQGRPDTVIRP